MDASAPIPADRFSFGLWTVGNPGRDPFGEPVRPVQDPCHLVRKLAECGACGVNLHDNDLVPFGASAQERDRIVGEFKAALEEIPEDDGYRDRRARVAGPARTSSSAERATSSVALR